ncbi:MAG: M43 family zinc metalloprotease [Bacteroidia bacterium]|nr:zinc metalloprotease [Bacteroidia bacterium]MDW8133865.1 M43 family zinc metalloprotease [Bacteroidia bacterium]
MRYLIFLLGFIGGLAAQSQWVRCGTMQHDSMMRALYRDWPSLDEYEPFIKQKVEEMKISYERLRTIGGVYRIPVVVHVIHNGEPLGTGSNIPDQNILDQIAVLNEDFRRMWNTPGWNNHPRGADARIEFVLAKRAPNGASTTGIVRWNRNTMGWNAPPYNMGYMDGTIKPATVWDPSRYFNIWVADLAGGLLGYAQFPSASGILGMPGDEGMGPCTQATNTDGVVVTYRSFGSARKSSTGLAAPYHLGRTTTHEVGHWLGLRHTWGDNATAGDCTPDDFCDDTPDCADPHYGCSVNPPSCVPGVRRMIENYMDYSDDACMNIFTLDQVLRMRVVIEYSPLRRSLITSPALVPPALTDAALIDLPLPQDICPGVYDIPAVLRNNGTNPLNSIPVAYNLNGGPWQNQTWTGNLAGGATTTFNLTGINLSTPGEYILTACSNLGGDPDPTEDTTATRIVVHNGFYPLFETFEHGWEGQPVPPRLWRVLNPNNDCYTWRPAHCTGSNGQRTIAMFVNCWAYAQTGRRDELYTPIIDLTGAPANVQLQFDVAYRRYDNNSNDELRVEIATNCGTSWVAAPIFQQSGAALATGANTTARFIPTAAADWQTRTVNLGAYVGQRVRLRFVTINQYGNCIWIDNIRITHQPIIFWREAEQELREELTWTLLTGDCRLYRDIQVPVQISAAPSANVTVSVAAAPSSTAREGIDFVILTPTLNFPAGSTNAVNAIIRVFDDQAIEPNRYADLIITVISGPAIVASNRQRHRLWINDNDFFPPEVILWREDFETGMGGFTQLTIVAGPNQWVRGTGAAMGSGHSLYITNDPGGSPPPHTYTITATSRVAAVSPAINTTNATDLLLAFDVLVGGEYTPNVLEDFGRLFYSTTSSTSGFQPLIGCAWANNTCVLGTVNRSQSLYGYPGIVRRIFVPLPTATWNQPNLWIAWRWDNETTGGTQPPIAIDNIVLYGRRTPPIETNIASTTVYIGPYDSLYAYSAADGDLMLCFANRGNANYGCTQIQVDRTGTNAQALRPTHTPPEYVTDKTFRILPATNNPNNPYNLTLYYTNAEVNGYQTTTGQSWNTAPYIVKTQGSIASEFTAPAPTYQLSAVRNVGNYGSVGRWIWGHFTQLSGFAVGAPPPLVYVHPEANPSSPKNTLYAISPFRDRIEAYSDSPFYKLQLRTLMGSVVWEVQGPFDAGLYAIEAPTLPAGLYLLEWLDYTGNIIGQQKVLRLP